MTAREGGSITGWLGDLKEGDQAAAATVGALFFEVGDGGTHQAAADA